MLEEPQELTNCDGGRSLHARVGLGLKELQARCQKNESLEFSEAAMGDVEERGKLSRPIAPLSLCDVSHRGNCAPPHLTCKAVSLGRREKRGFAIYDLRQLQCGLPDAKVSKTRAVGRWHALPPFPQCCQRRIDAHHLFLPGVIISLPHLLARFAPLAHPFCSAG
jgi:hypothetical protein